MFEVRHDIADGRRRQHHGELAREIARTHGIPGRQIGFYNVAEDGARPFVELLQLRQRTWRIWAVERLVAAHGSGSVNARARESRWTHCDPSNGPAFCGCWQAPARLGCAAP